MFLTGLVNVAIVLLNMPLVLGAPTDTITVSEDAIGTAQQYEQGNVTWFYSDSEGRPVSDNVHKRQSGTYITNTNRVGNGNPHQNRKFQQVTYATDCDPSDTCHASKTHSTTVGYSVSISGSFKWISGGFSVEKSMTDGETHTCDSNGHSSVCVWRNYQVTAYTVADTTCYYYNGAASMCSGPNNQRVIFSPNSCQIKAPFVCKYEGDCTGFGTNYLVKSGPAGGPPC